MKKYFLILISLISPSFSQVLAPMSKRSFDFLVEDICAHSNSNNDFTYVEPCEKDHKCIPVSSSSLGTTVSVCEKYVEADISFGSACEKDEDCDTYDNLKCIDSKCSLNENDNAIYLGSHYYCPDNLIPIQISSGIYKCEKRENHEMNGLCYLYKNIGSIHAYPDYMKICGEIMFDTEENNYGHLKTATNSIGSVKDGKFVDDELACESGFTLDFYPNGATTLDSSSTIPNTKYKRCVTYDGVEYKKNGYCIIKYILDKKNYKYDVQKILSSSSLCSEMEFIDTKLELFKKYVSKVNELGDQCTKNKYYDEPFTCKNDELRKFYYFYNHLNNYLLYKNEDEVSEFLLQQAYPSYAVQYSKTDESKFLSNNFICLLILLLL